MFSYAVQLLELLKYTIAADKTNLKIDSNEVVLPEVRQKQATAGMAMVAKHAKNYDLPSYKKRDVVKLLLPERFRKLSRKPFRICQVKSGPYHGLF
jgi:hypothetical protein